MLGTEQLPIGEVAHRAGMATSALRYYERLGLIEAAQDGRRSASLPAQRPAQTGLHQGGAQRRPVAGRDPRRARDPARGPYADGRRLDPALPHLAHRLDEQIDALVALRDGLTKCIGCGCLSLRTCALSNPGDQAAYFGDGAQYLPEALRED